MNKLYFWYAWHSGGESGRDWFTEWTTNESEASCVQAAIDSGDPDFIYDAIIIEEVQE